MALAKVTLDSGFYRDRPLGLEVGLRNDDRGTCRNRLVKLADRREAESFSAGHGDCPARTGIDAKRCLGRKSGSASRRLLDIERGRSGKIPAAIGLPPFKAPAEREVEPRGKPDLVLDP